MGFPLGRATPGVGYNDKSKDDFYEFCHGRCTMKKLIAWHKINSMYKNAVNRKEHN